MTDAPDMASPDFIRTFPNRTSDFIAQQAADLKAMTAERDAALSNIKPLCQQVAKLTAERDAAREAALREGYIAGAMAVHDQWVSDGGSAPKGHPEFGEAADDYAALINKGDTA